MTLFLGRYDYAMDDRGRVPLPPRYREVLAHGAVLGQGLPDRCLRLYSAQTFEEQSVLYTSEPPTHRAGRVTRKGFFATAFEVEPDKQGRVLIPAALRTYAGLENNVIVVGSGEWLEIWAPARFEEEMAAVDEQLENTLESMGPAS